MVEELLKIIGEKYPLKENAVDASISAAKVSGIKFTIRSFYAEGFGSVSLMTGAMPLGLMKMDTLIANPFEIDMPLFSYDRMKMAGKDILMAELYETRLEKHELPEMVSAESCADISNGTTEARWYDEIQLPQTAYKKGKKKDAARLDDYIREFLGNYLKSCAVAPACDKEKKRVASQVYTEGLLNNGGASTDLFLKAKGKEFTQRLFREVLFGTGTPE